MSRNKTQTHLVVSVQEAPALLLLSLSFLTQAPPSEYISDRKFLKVENQSEFMTQDPYRKYTKISQSVNW